MRQKPGRVIANSHANSKTRGDDMSLITPSITGTPGKYTNKMEGLKARVQLINIDCEKLLLEYKDKIEEQVFELLKMENQVTELKAQNTSLSVDSASLNQQLKTLSEQLIKLTEELQQTKKHAIETAEQNTLIDNLTQDFTSSMAKIEEQDQIIKIKEDQISDLRGQLQEDLLKYELDCRRQQSMKDSLANISSLSKRCLDIPIKSMLQIAQSNNKDILDQEITIVKEIVGDIERLCTVQELDLITINVNILKQYIQSNNDMQRHLEESKAKIKKYTDQLQTQRVDIQELTVKYQVSQQQSKSLSDQLVLQKAETTRLRTQNDRLYIDLLDYKKTHQDKQQALQDKIRVMSRELSSQQTMTTKAQQAEKSIKKVLKEYKKIIAALKQKMMELEGFAHEFKVKEKQSVIDNHKSDKQQEVKEKEVSLLRDKVRCLEEKCIEIEKKYSKVNPKAKNQDKEQQESYIQDQDIIQLKAHVFKQDEEIFVLKDMLKSATLQLKMRDSEIKRLKLKLKSLGVDYNPVPMKKLNLPSIISQTKSNQQSPDDSFREPSKMDKLNELSQKFKKQQEEKSLQKHMKDQKTQTDSKQAKSFGTQCLEAKKIESQVQTDNPIKKDFGIQASQQEGQKAQQSKEIQTQQIDQKPKIATNDSYMQTESVPKASLQFISRVIELQTNEQIRQPRQRKKKDKNQQQQQNEESEYEYYEEEVEVTEEEEQIQGNDNQPIYHIQNKQPNNQRQQ